MTPPNIGLLGRARVGKDTAAAHLIAEYGYRKIAFADPLRELARQVDPLIHATPNPESPILAERYADVEERLGYEAAKALPEFRGTLQRLGVACREVLGTDVWVDAWEESFQRASGPVVVTDVRFPNEATRLSELGFVLVRVVRDTPSDDSHVSEVALDDFEVDVTLRNDGSVDLLRSRVDAIVDLHS